MTREIQTTQSRDYSSVAAFDYQFSPRGDLMAYSSDQQLVAWGQTNVFTYFFTVTTEKDKTIAQGELDLNGEVYREQNTTTVEAGRPTSYVTEVMTSADQLVVKYSTAYTWDKHGNLLQERTEVRREDPTLLEDIMISDYTYVKRPFVESLSSGQQERSATDFTRSAWFRKKLAEQGP